MDQIISLISINIPIHHIKDEFFIKFFVYINQYHIFLNKLFELGFGNKGVENGKQFFKLHNFVWL